MSDASVTGDPAVSDALHGGEAPNGGYEAARVRIASTLTGASSPATARD